MKWEDSEEFREFIQVLNANIIHHEFKGTNELAYYGIDHYGDSYVDLEPFAELLTPSQAIARLKGEDETEKLKALLRECVWILDSKYTPETKSEKDEINELLTKIKEATK